MPVIIDWPANLRISDRSDPMLMANTRSGGIALNGDEQIISTGSRIWQWQMQVPIYNAGHMRALRVVLAQLDGRFGYVRTRICDQYRISRRNMGAYPIRGSVPHSDDAYFSDGSGYDLSGGTAYPINDSSPGQSQFQIDYGPDVPMSAGIFISIKGWLYLITAIDDPANLDDPGTVRNIHVSPPLRSAIGSDDEILWDAAPIWRLASDGEGQAFLRVGKFGVVTINLTEPVGRDEVDAP